VQGLVLAAAVLGALLEPVNPPPNSPRCILTPAATSPAAVLLRFHAVRHLLPARVRNPRVPAHVPAAQIQVPAQPIKHRTGRKTYHTVGMVPFPVLCALAACRRALVALMRLLSACPPCVLTRNEQGPVFVKKYRPSFVHYLNEVVGPKFDPPIDFTIRFEEAYTIEPFDDQTKNKIDFAFTYPNMAGCLEAEFLSSPLVTVRNYRGGRELNHYGGVVFTLADRDDINSIQVRPCAFLCSGPSTFGRAGRTDDLSARWRRGKGWLRVCRWRHACRIRDGFCGIIFSLCCRGALRVGVGSKENVSNVS